MKVTVLKSILRVSLVGYLIYSIDHRGVYYVFVDFEDAFVGIVHLIRPIISLSIISISVNLWENWLTDA